jgi:hypothetical protein
MMNILNLLTNTYRSLDEIIDAIGFKRSGDKLVPKTEYTQEHFLKVLTEYVESEVELGQNPDYVLGSLLENSNDQAVLREMLAEE